MSFSITIRYQKTFVNFHSKFKIFLGKYFTVEIRSLKLLRYCNHLRSINLIGIIAKLNKTLTHDSKYCAIQRFRSAFWENLFCVCVLHQTRNFPIIYCIETTAKIFTPYDALEEAQPATLQRQNGTRENYGTGLSCRENQKIKTECKYISLKNQSKKLQQKPKFPMGLMKRPVATIYI